MNYPNAPCQTLSLNDWVTPEAARIFINAVEELQKIGFKPTLSLFLDSKPEPKPEPKVEAKAPREEVSHYKREARYAISDEVALPANFKD